MYAPLSTDYGFGDQYHARFWGQVIRGICVDNFGFEGGLIKTRLDRTLWETGAEVQGRVRLTSPGGLPLSDATFSAQLVQESTVVAEMQPVPDPERPGEYFIRFPDTAPGSYTIDYEGESCELSEREVGVLRYLIGNPERPVPRDCGQRQDRGQFDGAPRKGQTRSCHLLAVESAQH